MRATGSDMVATLRDTVANTVARHFPDARPHYAGESSLAFGIDKHPRDDEHVHRYTAPFEGMETGFLSSAFSFSPADLAQDASLHSIEPSVAALHADLNRLVTGKVEGEKFEMDGLQRDRVTVSFTTKPEHAEGGLTILIHGTVPELHHRIQQNVRKYRDLSSVVPNSGQARIP